MAALVTAPITTSGSVLGVLAAASVAGDTMNVTDRTFLVIKNADTVPHTVTLITPGTVSGLAIADKPVVVANGTTVFIGPFGSVFVDSNDILSMTYDAVVAVTVGAFTL